MSNNSFLSLMAIGDAFGMKYEFVQRDSDIGLEDLKTFGPHPKFHEYKVAHYTDDTQMSLANAETLLKFKGSLSNLGDDDFIVSWLDAFRRDPRVGYSKHMYDVMEKSETVNDFKARLNPSMGVTSGAAMRAAPFGLITDIETVKSLTEKQAKLTHDTPSGINSALAVSLTTHFLHHAGARDGAMDFLKETLGSDWNSAVNGYSDDPNNGLKIVGQSLNAIQGVDTLSEVLLKAINQDYKSDTDTICALAFVMASRCVDIKNDLPNSLFESVENQKYGYDFLQKHDDALSSAYPSHNLGY